MRKIQESLKTEQRHRPVTPVITPKMKIWQKRNKIEQNQLLSFP